LPRSFTIADLSTLRVEVSFDEVDVVRLKEGQAALVKFDALRGQDFAATLSYIAPVSAGATEWSSYLTGAEEEARGAVWYRARLTLARQDLRIRPGMTAEVEIVVEHKRDVLWLPPQAIEESAQAAWVTVGSKPPGRRQAVKVGLRTNRRVEIVEGVRAGDKVIIPAARFKERRREAFPGFF